MGRHPYKALTVQAVKNITEPGFYADGNGLHLKVDKNGSKRWIQRIVIDGKRRDLGLGSLRLVSLKEARDQAEHNRKVARAGGDPLADKRKITEVMTFEQAANTVYENSLPTWSNPKHAKQWISTLTTYVFPRIGSKKMDKITSEDVLEVLLPIWTSKIETASRVKQRISSVMKYGIAKGWRIDDPSLTITSALPKPNRVVKNQRSLPYPEVSGAIQTIRDSEASLSAKLALEMLILTALRSGEVRLGKWNEVDMDTAVWTIPAERMKQRKPHRVPLSQRCLEILTEAKKINTESGYIFPGNMENKPLSDSTLSKLVRDNKIKCVPHGFRSSFRVWAAEQTNIPREVCEFALAHVVGNEAERAYQRSDLFEKRRKLMDMWVQYLAANKGEVIKIRALRYE